MSLTGVNDAAERRTNQMLRYALDKYLLGEHDRVNEFDVYLFRATFQKLAEIPEPSAGQTRLRNLVEGALAQYAALAERLDTAGPGGSGEAEASGALDGTTTARIVQASDFFVDLPRKAAPAVGGIQLDAQVRVYEQQGPLTLHGDVPEDAMLIVRGGDLVLHGMLLGHAYAEENVKVLGNVQGGTVVSERGNIEAGRVLPGACLSAPKGTIQVAALERPGRVFAGRALQVAGSVRGGTLFAGGIQVQGQVSGATIHVLGGISASEIQSDAREPTRIYCRNVLTARDYGRAVPEEIAARMRGLSRIQFRAQVGTQVMSLIHAELCAAQRAVLYLISGPKLENPTLEVLRTTQSQAVYCAILAAAAEGALQVILDVHDMDRSLLRSAALYVAEECHTMIRSLEHDIAGLPDEIARSSKEALHAGCRHLSNLARKLQEATLDRGDLQGAFQAILSRAQEWRSSAENAEARLTSFQPVLAAAIGSAAPVAQPGDKLQILMQHGIEQAKKDPNRARLADGVLFRSMLSHVERYQASLNQWTAQITAARQEWEDVQTALAEEAWLTRRPDASVQRSIRADNFSSGVLLAMSSAYQRGEDFDDAPAIQLAMPISSPTAFVVHGVQLRRLPPRMK